MKTTFRTAKVVAVHRESHTVDVILMDGNWVRDVPVLGFGGSNFGLVGLVAPTADKTNKNRKTYPGTDGGAGRDLYAVLGQAEGSSFGTNGMFVLGFLYPQVSEMMFAGDKHPNLMLYRHPSDLQMTVDTVGKTSVQHPSGCRITIGTDFGAVSLEGADFDRLYRLRNNLGQHVGIQMEDTAGSVVTLDHEGNIDRNAPKNTTEEAGVDVKEKAGRDDTTDAGRDVTEVAGRDDDNRAGRDWNVKAGRDGDVKIGRDLSVLVGRDADVKVGQDVSVLVGQDVDVTVGQQVSVQVGKTIAVQTGENLTVLAGESILATAGDIISLQAPIIFLN